MPRASVRRAARRAGRRSSCSRLRSWPWPSTLQVRGVAEAGDDLRLDRQLHRRALERQRSHRAGDAVEFEQDAAGLDARGPEFGRALALAHADLGGLRRHGDVEIGRAHVELQSLMRNSYAVFCLKKKKKYKPTHK